MNIILEKTSKIRNHVNHPWKLEILFSDRVKWDKVCSSMDVLDDTQSAIDNYFNLPDFSSDSGGYLFLYGLLQAFFLQQDASNHLTDALFNQTINWQVEYPDLHLIRELRNESVGHPTEFIRKGEVSFHYIARFSLNKNSFELASYYPAKQNTLYRDIDIFDLKNKQENSVSNLLDKVIQLMEIDLKNHKKKFQNMKLKDLVPNDFSYCIGKVYEGIYNNYPLAEMNFTRIKETHESIKSAIDKRYTSYKALESVEDVVRRIDYIIIKMETWIKNKELHKNSDAEVFMDSFNERFKELEEMLLEIDEEFENNTV